MDILPDLLTPDLKLVVCGTAAGRRSAELGAYYAGPGNRFWAMLHRTGATRSLLTPPEFRGLLAHCIGLTDIAKKAFGADRELAASDFDRAGLRRRMLEYRPAVLAFNGKRAAREYFARDIDYGYQQGDDIGATRIYVGPSTSGAARGFWNEEIWRQIVSAAGLSGLSTE
jgi:TDG/mug DNA glycosylase family protein